tara:strand:- start:598 stop:747 length:150 start_codon:yes stop_codon:yes gene_type:complete
MNEKFTSNNYENDELNLNTEESDYKNLVTRLREISSTIALLEKRYLDKF